MARTKKTDYMSSVGRRKEATARIRLYSGKGNNMVNGLPIEEYFPSEEAKIFYQAPFELTKTLGKYYASIKCKGGGKLGQLVAVVHGISRALCLADKEKFRPILKKNGLLTRDPRERERRKIGTGGKARRKKQSPKR